MKIGNEIISTLSSIAVSTMASSDLQRLASSAEENVTLVIDGLYDAEKLFGPTEQEAAQDQTELDGWEAIPKQADDVTSPALTKQAGTQFLPADAELDNQLENDAGLLNHQPEIVLKFIAKNTNPRRIVYIFQNILTLITEFLKSGKANMVVERNCVHCTQAVEKTLTQFPLAEKQKPHLFQVKNPGQGEFVGISPSVTAQELTGERDLLDVLRSLVQPNQRACIGVPVLGKPYSHAMNYVRYNKNEFVICGQTGTVYNMTSVTDQDKFAARYGVEKQEGGRFLQVIVTGKAP
jgi:hypothetical protein